MNSRMTVMVSIILAMLVASMDTTIMNTTMPIIAKELGGLDLYAWTFTSYMITTTVLSPIAGRLSDIFGRKKVFGFGIILFLIGSLLCGMSQSMLQLVLFRAVQGIGAGFMMPFPAIIAGDLFPIEKRGKIQAFFTAMWGLSALLAPLLGAFFVEYMTWRWIFYINLPICLLVLVTLLPYKEVYEPKKTTVDYIGASLFAVGVSLLLLVTVVENNHLPYALAGLLFLVVFYILEKKHTSPLVPLTMLHHRTIKWMNINSFIGCAALFGTSSYIPLYIQDVTHQTLFMSGLALLGMAIGWMIVSIPSGKWILQYGYRNLLIIGNGLLVVSGTMLALLNAGSSFLYVFLTLFVQGLAFGLLSTVGVIGSQQMADPHQKGIATSFFMFCRNIGTAAGVTVMGAFLTNAADIMTGIHHLFLYGFAGSIVALLTSFFIKDDHAVERGGATIKNQVV